MKAYDLTVLQIFNQLNTSQKGLDSEGVKNSKRLHGENKITKLKQKSLLRRIGEALLEPMLLILEVAMIITLGVNLGKFLKTGDGDFYECIGILLSIAISVFLTVYMEGKSRKAFELLDGLAGNVYVKVIRNGEKQVVLQSELAVGDVVFIEAGDKIFADGRLISSNGLSVDESTLTGESNSVSKTADLVLNKNTPLAERKNMVYSGTFAVTGNGSYVVTAVGDGAEMGVIANDLQTSDTVSAPLQEKLGKLSKTITWFGILSATFVLILTVARQFANNSVSFSSLQEAFLSAIVLIVASVPEGLPTTVAIALTLNVVKLSKSNALIKKLVATETVGCVSVICSDKTGTLTENKMTVIKTVAFSGNEGEILLNSALNSTAFLSGKKSLGSGSPTEIALLEYALKRKKDYKKLREEFKIEDRIPFSSDLKYMTTTVSNGSVKVKYLKGAPEKVIDFCAVDDNVKNAELEKIKSFQLDGKRVIAFAHGEEGSFHYDGFSVIADPVRKDVKRAVDECRRAGISVKMLTGDNVETAYSIARELGLAEDKSSVIVASDLDGLSDDKFKETLKTITVVARSTPKTKLKIVTALKETGEVVAVTGDGVNDAPALKRADVGFAMGSGTEAAKEAGKIVVLDDNFRSIKDAIWYGRTIYHNILKFCKFQLVINVAAVIVSAFAPFFGVEEPLKVTHLLFVNLVMDGLGAIMLGNEPALKKYMTEKPRRRDESIVNMKMMTQIVIMGLWLTILSFIYLKAPFFVNLFENEAQHLTGYFVLFIVSALFNGFNVRDDSFGIFRRLNENTGFLKVFFAIILIQAAIINVALIPFAPCQWISNMFSCVPFGIIGWITVFLLAATMIPVDLIRKLVMKLFTKKA